LELTISFRAQRRLSVEKTRKEKSWALIKNTPPVVVMVRIFGKGSAIGSRRKHSEQNARAKIGTSMPLWKIKSARSRGHVTPCGPRVTANPALRSLNHTTACIMKTFVTRLNGGWALW